MNTQAIDKQRKTLLTPVKKIEQTMLLEMLFALIVFISVAAVSGFALYLQKEQLDKFVMQTEHCMQRQYLGIQKSDISEKNCKHLILSAKQTVTKSAYAYIILGGALVILAAGTGLATAKFFVS